MHTIWSGQAPTLVELAARSGVLRHGRIEELAAVLAEATGFAGEIRWDRTKPNGQPRRCLDISRAEAEFGFRAQVDFSEGLRRTVDWYLSTRSQCFGR